MSRIVSVIFDVYETLAQNYTWQWIDTFRRICRVQSLDVAPEDLYREWKALDLIFRRDKLNLEEPESGPPFKSYEEAWRDSFIEAFRRLRLAGDAVAAAKETIVDMGLRAPYGDALEALPLIQARWRTGVLSNADDSYLLPLLKRIGWKFEAVLSSEAAEAYKPLPSGFRQIMGQLGVLPEETIYVGDTLYDDILGAQGVGMRAVWVNRYGAEVDPRFPTPDYEVRSLSELPDILQAVS